MIPYRCGEGHSGIVKLLLERGADPNVEDRWGRSPLDDAMEGHHQKCAALLQQYGAIQGKRPKLSHADDMMDSSQKRSINNMKIDFQELQLIDRIGAGAFGEIYKCRYVLNVFLLEVFFLFFMVGYSLFPLKMERYSGGGQDY